jgi:dienelactone hydrolase
MKTQLHVIYVPGLGDFRARGQEVAVKLWRHYGVAPEMIRMYWQTAEPWKTKLQRLLDRIDTLHTAGYQVALVGSSAGATAVIAAFAARPTIVGCVVIVGKVNHPASIGGAYRAKNPALVTASQDCERALRSLPPAMRLRIQSRYAALDEVVRQSDSHIPGARNRRLFSIGHSLTIGLQLTIGVPFWLRFLRKLRANKLYPCND